MTGPNCSVNLGISICMCVYADGGCRDHHLCAQKNYA